MAGAFREEKNADKIFKRLSKLDTKPNASRPTIWPIPGTYIVTPPMRKQIKKKEIQKTDNPEA
jgi:hypothetical protein